jgi:hypothetical protein
MNIPSLFNRSRILAALALLLLAACATPASVTPGAAEASVLQRLGKPLAVHALPDNMRRLEYEAGGLSQLTWMIDVDPSGRVARVEQVHSLASFNRLRSGVDNLESVRRALGTPWMEQRFTLSKLTGWSYPYVENGMWNSVMTMLFDEHGVLVRQESGPDQRFLGGSDDWSD